MSRLHRFVQPMLLVVALAAVGMPAAHAQMPEPTMNPELRRNPWSAAWIAAPDDPGNIFGVYHFRRAFELETAPSEFVVHVSADNRYRLYVNGADVAAGPARGDEFNWRFESLDLAPYLRAGSNVIAAVVWNFGALRPMAQHSHRTAFLLQGDTAAERIVDTGPEWVVHENQGYAPVPVDREELGWVYIVVGPGEQLDARRHPWGWREREFEDSTWPHAVPVRDAVEHWGANHGEVIGWRLTPRTIPMMQETPIRFDRIRRASGVEPNADFVGGSSPLIVPAHTTATLLLDQGNLVTAYPELTISGGSGSRIQATYAEALFDASGRKGHRDVIEGKSIRGIRDVFLSDGGDDRLFRPLWFRTYRYVQLDVQTGDEPLTLEDYRGVFTAYPFEEEGRFAGSDTSFQQIWDVGWRTARLCAAETYFDCPYYEQLQYVGDTRIQALVSLYVAGDDRLMRKAIESFDHSRLSIGLTQSRYPSYDAQIIPPYSLFWIVMIHDYWMHRDDPAFVQNYLTGIRGVVEWYEGLLDETGLVGPTPWWNFVDWSYPRGVPPGADEGHSSIIALQLVYALQRAAELADAFDRADEAARYRALAERINDAVYKLCWDAGRGLVADSPEKKSFSQHASLMAVLTDAIPQNDHRPVMERVLTDSTLVPSTYYYRFYLDEAARKAGLAESYTDRLDPWRDMLALGLTTFAEEPDPTRSDAHAWSSSPNYHFLATVCGIRPASPGFETVRVEPALGDLSWIEGSVPMPAGEIELELRAEEDELSGHVVLPEGVTGTFYWQGNERTLPSGRTTIRLDSLSD